MAIATCNQRGNQSQSVSSWHFSGVDGRLDVAEKGKPIACGELAGALGPEVCHQLSLERHAIVTVGGVGHYPRWAALPLQRHFRRSGGEQEALASFGSTGPVARANRNLPALLGRALRSQWEIPLLREHQLGLFSPLALERDRDDRDAGLVEERRERGRHIPSRLGVHRGAYVIRGRISPGIGLQIP